MSGAVFALTPAGRQLALKIGAAVGFTVCLPQALYREGDNAVSFEDLRTAIAASFASYNSLVLVMASGIAVRMIAPLLQDKTKDPAVVVMDEGGHFAIPLLSGHWGGANDLARKLSVLCGAVPVITTATDVAGVEALDVLARRLQVRLEPFSLVKKFSAAQLRGETVEVYGDQLPTDCAKKAGLRFFKLEELDKDAPADNYRALITYIARHPLAREGDLYLRPPCLYVGVGCRRGVEAEAVIEALRSVLNRFNLAESCLAALSSIDIKRDEEGLMQAAQALSVPVYFCSKEEIRGVAAECGQSPFVQEKMGVGAVCEPTALLAAKSHTLLVPKQKMNGITIAVALGAYPWLEPGPAQQTC